MGMLEKTKKTLKHPALAPVMDPMRGVMGAVWWAWQDMREICRRKAYRNPHRRFRAAKGLRNSEMAGFLWVASLSMVPMTALSIGLQSSAAIAGALSVSSGAVFLGALAGAAAFVPFVLYGSRGALACLKEAARAPRRIKNGFKKLKQWRKDPAVAHKAAAKEPFLFPDQEGVVAESVAFELYTNLIAELYRKDWCLRLARSGGGLSTRNPNGETPLHGAAYVGDLDLLRVMVEQVADVSIKVIQMPTEMLDTTPNQPHYCEKYHILSAGTTDATPGLLGAQLIDGIIEQRNEDALIKLVEAGADVDAKDRRSGKTALAVLMCTSYGGSMPKLARALIAHGADVSVCDPRFINAPDMKDIFDTAADIRRAHIAKGFQQAAKQGTTKTRKILRRAQQRKSGNLSTK